MRQALYYIFIVAKNSSAHKKKVLFQMINHAVFLFFTFFLYQHLYKIVPGLSEKLPFPNAIWSMAVYFIIFWISLQRIERNFREDIKSGNIEMYLLRPFSYILQKIYIQVGEGLLSLVSAAVLSIGTSYFLVGMPEVNAPYVLWALLVLVLLVLSQVLACLIYVLCGLSGFWLENSEPVYFVVTKLIMVFGGSWVPVAFFPHALQMFANFSPFGGVMAISFSMYPDFLVRFPMLLLNVVFWIAVCLLLVHFVSRRAFKRLAVNG